MSPSQSYLSHSYENEQFSVQIHTLVWQVKKLADLLGTCAKREKDKLIVQSNFNIPYCCEVLLVVVLCKAFL